MNLGKVELGIEYKLSELKRAGFTYKGVLDLQRADTRIARAERCRVFIISKEGAR